jgi:hypothetical protein
MHLLLLLFENRPGHIADAVHLRPVDLRLHLGLVPHAGAAASAAALQNVGAHTFSLIRLDGARMRFLLGNPDCRESVQNLFTLDFQLPR